MDFEWKQEQPRENVILGTVGAFFGTLIGAACIVMGSRETDINAVVLTILSGVVMAVGAVTGYAQMGCGLSKRGAVISCLLVIVMNYIANQFDFLLAMAEVVSELGEIDVSEILQRLDPEVREWTRQYWNELPMRYLLTLIAAAPILISSVRPMIKQSPSYLDTDIKKPAIQGVFYALRKEWMRPLHMSVRVPGLILMETVLLMLLAGAIWIGTTYVFLMILVTFLCIPLFFVMLLPTILLCDSTQILFVRAGGRLWMVDLFKFYHVEPPRPRRDSSYTIIIHAGGKRWEAAFRKFGFFLDWSMLPADLKRVIQYDILREIKRLLDNKIFSSAVKELKNLRVEKETRWSWTLTYKDQNGERARLKIGKGYPDFSPVPGVECSDGPVPYRLLTASAFLLTAAFIVGSGIAFGLHQIP